MSDTALHLTQDHIETILCELASGLVLPDVVKRTGVPMKILWRFLDQNPDIRKQYDFALRCQAQVWMQECVQIADDRHIKGDDKRIQIDTRMKLAAKYHPELFGEKQHQPAVTVNVSLDRLSDEELERKIRALQAKLLRPVDGITLQH